MKTRKIVRFICYSLLVYGIFICIMGLRGRNSVDDDLSNILVPLIEQGKFKINESELIINPVSVEAQNEWGISLALCMQATLRSAQKSKNFLSYLNGDFVYYYFKCERQEKIMIPYLYQLISDTKQRFELERDALQETLDDLNKTGV